MLSLIGFDVDLAIIGYGIAITLAMFLLGRFLSKSTIDNIPGPEPQSWLLGNQAQIERTPSAECDFKWFRQFGHTWRIKGGYSEDILMTSDPKALQYILQTSGYNFKRVPFIRERVKILAGPGILWAEGNVHKRHRKVMLPSFALPEIKMLTPIFLSKARGFVNLLNVTLAKKKGTKMAVDVHPLLERATLDAIGEAAFNYKFGSLDKEDNALAENFQGLLLATGAFSSTMKIIITNTLPFLPPMTVLLAKILPTSGNRRLRQNLKVSSDVSKQLLASKLAAIDTNAEKKDVMSVLVKSNTTENPRSQLSDDEITAQMNTLMLAGHETTASTITWCLWELAKNPEVQNKLQQEVNELYQNVLDRGDEHISVSEYDSMHYMMSFIKEVLRYHCILPNIPRMTAHDLIVPLSNPVQTTDGQLIQEIPLKKGTRVIASVAQYNRLPELWGHDVDIFRPERWSEGLNTKFKFGVIGNLATFGAGIHACIGWRFAMYEIQTFLIEIMNNFKFEMADDTSHVSRAFSGVLMQPVLEGKRNKKATMPLMVSARV